jgi:hypothetical protein
MIVSRPFGNLNHLGYNPMKKLCMMTPAIASSSKGAGMKFRWKQFHQPLPNSYSLSQQRLHCLLRRLRQNPTLLRDYDRIIQEQIEKGRKAQLSLFLDEKDVMVD